MVEDHANIAKPPAAEESQAKKSNCFDQQALALDRIGTLVACLVQSLWQLHAESAMIDP